MATQERDVFQRISLEKLSYSLGNAWPSLATKLGFDDAEVQTIIVAFEGRVSKQAHHMLQAWRERNEHDDSDLMMRTLIRALKEIRRYELLKELGVEVEILDNETMQKVAKKIGTSWTELALYLGFDIDECDSIATAFSTPSEQAGQMLAHWRLKFSGVNPLEYLIKELLTVDPDLVQELGTLQQIPPCSSCGNDDPVKFNRYFSQGQAQLIGLSCSSCGREWLEDRFLYQPDADKTRASFKLCGVVLKEQCMVPIERNTAFMVQSSRTEISNLDFVGDYLKVGDHIAWHRPYIIWHHAIVTGVVDAKKGIFRVIHWHKIEWGCGPTQIMEHDIDLNTQSGHLYRIDYPDEMLKVNPKELVIARAKSRLGDTSYGVFSDNCEVFASYCKTGVAESCQICWFYNKVKVVINEALATTVKSAVRSGLVVAKEYIKESSKAFMQQVGSVSLNKGAEAIVRVGGAETFERLANGTDLIGAGIVIVIEGIACVWNIGEFYENRKEGNLSRNEFVKAATQRVAEAVCGAGLSVGLSLAGQALGAAVGTLIFPGLGTAIGGFIGSVIGGVVGSFVGRGIGYLIGPPIGRFLASAIGTNDKAVRIEDLMKGDQIVSYGNILHPRHHAIVVECNVSKSRVRVIHSTYKKGVVEEEVDFVNPVYRLVYTEPDCYPPDEVLARARSKIGDDFYTYSLVWKNCKHFAQCCKLKAKKQD